MQLYPRSAVANRVRRSEQTSRARWPIPPATPATAEPLRYLRFARDDMPALKEELGDLLLQVVYHSQMASEMPREAGAFRFEDVAAAIADKMVDRHPHVFGGAEARTAADVTQHWEHAKQRENRAGDGDAAADPLGALRTRSPGGLGRLLRRLGAFALLTPLTA